MKSENGIRKERPGVESVLKAMNREGQLREAPAGRQEIRAKQQSDQEIPESIIGRSSSSESTQGSAEVPVKNPHKAITCPKVESGSEPSLLQAKETAPVHAEIRPAPPSIVRSRFGLGAAGSIAFGFGIGLGIGAGAYLTMTMFGNPIEQSVAADAPDLIDVPSKAKPETAVVESDLAWHVASDGSDWAPDATPGSRLSWAPLHDLSYRTNASSGLTAVVSPDPDAWLPSEALAFTQLEGVSRPIPKEEVFALRPHRRTLATGNTNPKSTSSLEPSETPAPSALHIPGAEGYTVHLNAPSKASREDVDHVAETVRGTGMSQLPIQRVGFNVGATQVRYFHDDDAPAAKELAERLGAQARDFTSFRPSPQIGSIEIYVAGNGASAAPRSSRRSRQTPPLERFLNRLFNGSRRGNSN